MRDSFINGWYEDLTTAIDLCAPLAPAAHGAHLTDRWGDPVVVARRIDWHATHGIPVALGPR